MVMQKERAARQLASKMEKLFADADADGDGELSMEEFCAVLAKPKVKTWLAAMELDVTDVTSCFDLLDDGDMCLSPLELFQGASRLKGAAKNMDVLTLMRKTTAIQEVLEEIKTRLTHESQAACHEAGLIPTGAESESARSARLYHVKLMECAKV